MTHANDYVEGATGSTDPLIWLAIILVTISLALIIERSRNARP